MLKVWNGNHYSMYKIIVKVKWVGTKKGLWISVQSMLAFVMFLSFNGIGYNWLILIFYTHMCSG